MLSILFITGIVDSVEYYTDFYGTSAIWLIWTDYTSHALS